MAKDAKTVKKGRPEITVIDPNSLTDDEKAALRAQARAQVDAEVRQRTTDALFVQYLQEERRKGDPQEETKYIVLDMAGHSDRIMIDGVAYFHGTQYGVPLSLYNVLRDVVQAGWRHEDEIGGANRSSYNKPRQIRLSPNMANLPASAILHGGAR